jgi:hypothetical protein
VTETAGLRGFASKARADLLKEVGARVTVVLAENSVARSESASAVRALEDVIARDGREVVVDRVAYTWFNRIIALRFMDANGYTPSGVVSPADGATSGQPEVLAEAKAGSFDGAVVPVTTQELVTALLNGTRPSQDGQAEAYGLLLEAYCRSWNRAMPFMFEREGDYTELLIPSALLAPDSVRDRAVKVLTEDVCRDVEVIGWLYQFYIADRKNEVFEGFKKNRKAGAAEIPAATQLFTPHWIVRYLVENSVGRLWLLNNPSSHLAEQMDYYIAPVDEETDFLKIAGPEELTVIDPAVGSGHMLTYAFDLLYEIYSEKGYDPAEIPGLILEHNLFGTEIDPRAGALAAFALTMKAAAKRKLFLKNPVQPNIRVLENIHFDAAELDHLWSLTPSGIDRRDADAFWNAFEHADTLGSLIHPRVEHAALFSDALRGAESERDLIHTATLQKARAVIGHSDYLSERYTVALANPPYMGNGNMSPLLSGWTRREFPNAKSDLFACFIERATALVVASGRVAMVTMHSWMFLSSFSALRVHLLRSNTLESMAHLGTSAFDSIGGAVVATTAFVLQVGRRPDSNRRGAYVRLVDIAGEQGKASAIRAIADGISSDRLYLSRDSMMLALPGGPIAYSASAALITAMTSSKTLGTQYEPRTGMNTGDNARFVRNWWEVSLAKSMFDAQSTAAAHASGRKWFPYNKGGPYRRWYGNHQSVIAFDAPNYEVLSEQGNHLPSRQYYFAPSVAWTKIATSSTSFRLFPAGFVFDGAGVSLFAEADEQRLAILGFLNSSTAESALRLLSPTLNFQSGDIARLPTPIGVDIERVRKIVGELVGIAQSDWNSHELSWNFRGNSLVGPASDAPLRERWREVTEQNAAATARQRELEVENHQLFADHFGLSSEVSTEVSESSVSLWANASFGLESLTPTTQHALATARSVADLVSHVRPLQPGCAGSGPRRSGVDVAAVPRAHPVAVVHAGCGQCDPDRRWRLVRRRHRRPLPSVSAGCVRGEAFRGEPAVRAGVARGEGLA